VRLDYSHGSETYGNVAESPYFYVPAYENIDAMAEISGNNWSVSAYMRNVLDEKYWTGTVGGAASSLRGGMGVFVPRSYGVRFTYNWAAD
jgi:outer membrane receptor protein involved in Fe transport